jgi:hypothetical protein
MICFAAKQLSSADLAFFKCHSTSKFSLVENSIKLEADVLVTRMFPYLRSEGMLGEVSLPVLLAIDGPGFAELTDEKTRLLYARSGRSRIWHLTGERVPDPDGNRVRYHHLAHSDYVIFALRQAEYRPLPKYISMLLLSRKHDRNALVIGQLTRMMAGQNMIGLSLGQLGKLDLPPWGALPDTTVSH